MIVGACELSNTGLPVSALAGVGAVIMLAGVAAYGLFGVRTRRGRLGGGLALLLLLGGALGGGGMLGVGSGSPAVAAAVTPAGAGEGCAPGGGGGAGGGGGQIELTIIQTSVNTGIAPGAAPTRLTGRITNNGTQSTPIAFVTVSIESVAKAPDAIAGTCDGSDYAVDSAAMPVGRTLAPGESADFGGASIAFSTTTENQDACKGATLRLRYLSS